MPTQSTESHRHNLNIDRATELIAAWKSSGRSLEEFADSHQVSLKTLQRWERRLRTSRAVSPPTFVQVQTMTCSDVTIQAQGVTVIVPGIMLESCLPAVVRALRC